MKGKLDSGAKKVLVFIGKDEKDHPTPEMRRAWRKRGKRGKAGKAKPV